MLFLEFPLIDPGDPDSLLEKSFEKDYRYNDFIQSINQAVPQCINLYDNYYDLMPSTNTLPFNFTDEFYSIISEYVVEHGTFTAYSLEKYFGTTIGKVD